MSNFNESLFICLDCETTGLDTHNDEIIEFAAIKFCQKDGIIDTLTFLSKPKKIIPEESIKIHGITNEDVEFCDPFKNRIDDIRDFIKDLPIVGHAVNFDISIIKNQSKACGKKLDLSKNLIIDTLRLAKRFHNSDSNTLSGLCHHFNIDISTKRAHRALDDTIMNMQLFIILIAGFKDLSSLAYVISRPIKLLYMPFGKFRGSKISSLSYGYLLHLNKSKKIDDDMKYTIQQELKFRRQGLTENKPLFNLL